MVTGGDAWLVLAMDGGAWLVDGYAMWAERWLCRDWREEALLVVLRRPAE